MVRFPGSLAVGNSLDDFHAAIGEGFHQSGIGALLRKIGAQFPLFHVHSRAIQSGAAGVNGQPVRVGIDQVRRAYHS